MQIAKCDYVCTGKIHRKLTSVVKMLKNTVRMNLTVGTCTPIESFIGFSAFGRKR